MKSSLLVHLMKEVDFDNLEGNAHLILYYLVKIFPELKEKHEIAQVTGLHPNTIYTKLKFLNEKKLTQKKYAMSRMIR